MKKIVLLLVSLMSFGTVVADDYLPMVREGVKWVYRLTNLSQEDDKFDVVFISYEFKDEVEINGMTYKKCWKTIEDKSGTFDATPTVIAYVREQDKKVYAIYDDAFVSQTRDYNAGYREFGAHPYFNVQNMLPTDIDLITLHEYTYKDYNDEFLIYDFNDLAGFYKKYPAKSYNCGYVPGRYYDENHVLQYIQENQDVIFTVSKQADSIGYVSVQGRNLMQYKLKTIIKSRLETRQASGRIASGDVSTASNEVGLNDESLLLIEGYGVYNLGRGQRIPKRNIAAFYCRSFMSPEGMMRHIDESIFDNVADALSFSFCHIEENGERVIQRELCDHYHDIYNNSGSGNVAVDDLHLEYVKCDGAYYDMQGRRIMAEPAAPGIYIHNGKKVVVK